MPSYNCPRTYEQAAERIAAGAASAELTVTPDHTITVRKIGEGIAVCFDGDPLVTFYADGRLKLITHGRNNFSTVSRINGCLPRPYRVRKSGCHLQLVLPQTRNGKGHTSRVVAEFLGGTTFAPDAAPIAAGAQ